jgi:hypothetical protein
MLTNTSPTKQRVCMVVAILCGALAATLVWRIFHPVASLSDLQAQKLGYASAKDEQDAKRLFLKVSAAGSMDDTEFAAARDGLMRGSFTRRSLMVVALGNLKGAKQHSHAISELDGVTIDPDRRIVWLSTFRKWVRYQHDKNALPLLLASKNPDVVELAKELQNEG